MKLSTRILRFLGLRKKPVSRCLYFDPKDKRKTKAFGQAQSIRMKTYWANVRTLQNAAALAKSGTMHYPICP